MPKKEFALERGGPKRLIIKWTGIWKNIDVAFDGRPLGTIENQKALKAGRSFDLGDGTEVQVKLKTGIGAELQVTRDGAPLPGSGSDPEERLKAAWGVIFFIAGLNAVLGVVTLAFDIEVLQELGLGLGSLFTGVVYAGLGFAVRTYRSAVALGIALALFALDGLANFVLVAMAGGNPPVGGIVARVFLIMPMIRGFAAIKDLKASAPVPSLGVPEGAPSEGEPWQPPRES